MKKNQTILLTLAACSLMALGNGCSKQESAPPPISQAPPTPATPAADALNAAQAQAVADQKAAASAAASKLVEAEKAAQAEKQAQAEKLAQLEKQAQAEKLALLEKQAQADKLAAEQQAQLVAAGAKAQGLIDTARGLMGESKWADALKVLSQLATEKLTGPQQTVVDGLKVDAQKQAQAAVTQKATQGAASALGGLLDPKK